MQPSSFKRLRTRHVALVIGSLLVLGACTDQTGDETATPNTASADISEQPPSTQTQPSEGAWQTGNYGLLPIAEVAEPTAAVRRPESPQLWVAERNGIVRVVDLEGIEQTEDPSAPITIQAPDNTVLDISDRVSTEGEGGLLSIVFSPDGQRLYVSYTDTDQNSVIAEFEMNGDRAGTNERIVLQVEQPFTNHNGGDITFGPDNMLYIGLGDGGSGGDPEGNGQDLSTLLGSVLRIDPTPSDNSPFTIPEDNPFTAANNQTAPDNARPEAWAYGLRNPWRFSFDAQTGDLWIADVGQNQFEEIDYFATTPEGAGRGANLGWNSFEGDQSFEGRSEPADHHKPLFTYETNQDQCSVIGGYVYRGQLIEALDGVYLFSDFCSDSIIGIEQQDGEIITNSALTFDRSVENVVSFGQGPAGEIYVLEQGGQISRIVELEGGGNGVA